MRAEYRFGPQDRLLICGLDTRAFAFDIPLYASAQGYRL